MGLGPDRLPAAFRGRNKFVGDKRRSHRGLAACVRKLNSGANALPVDEFDDAGKTRNVFVLVNAKIVRRNPAFRDDRRRFEHDQTGSALSAATEVHHVPVVGEAVVRRVLAHGRDADAIVECDRTKLKGSKKRMAHVCYG